MSVSTPVADHPIVVRARQFAAERLDDPGRLLDHARGTAAILAEIRADPQVQAAAWLYGSDRPIAPEQLRRHFGDEVTQICLAMRQLRDLRELHQQRGDERTRDAAEQLETLRRMLLAMSVDIRVVLLRLASRLQTLRDHRQRRVAPAPALCRETLDVFAPLTNRLGLWQLKWEMEDLAFRSLQPKAYTELAGHIGRRRSERQQIVDQAASRLEQSLLDDGLQARVTGRPKHLYSIHNKMKRKSLSIDQIHDLLALRVVVPSIDDCYRALDRVQQVWEAMPGEYDDYIARPKANGYQSLHTVVRTSDGTILEVQIRTAAMHEAAEYGLAAHWQYKEGKQSRAGQSDAAASNVDWLRQLLAWQSEMGESLGATNAGGDRQAGPSMGDAQAVDDHIYVLTPAGRILSLASGATPVDFAYQLHTELGHRCRGAQVDGRMVPLTTPLKTGQTIQIVSARDSDRAGPSRDWLNPELGFLVTNRARAKVRQWFSARESERERAAGRATVERILQREGQTGLALEKLAERLGFDTPANLYAAVFHGDVGPRALEQAIRGQPNDPVPPVTTKPSLPGNAPVRRRRVGNPVLIEGDGSLLTHIARCCRPVPGDPICGYVTQGRGVTVHRANCSSLANLKLRTPQRVLNAQWIDDESSQAGLQARLAVRTSDAVAVDSLIADLSARMHVPASRQSLRHQRGESLARVDVQPDSRDQLNRFIAALSQMDGVIDVTRE